MRRIGWAFGQVMLLLVLPASCPAAAASPLQIDSAAQYWGCSADGGAAGKGALFINARGIAEYKAGSPGLELYPFPEWLQLRLAQGKVRFGAIRDPSEWSFWLTLDDDKNAVYLVHAIARDAKAMGDGISVSRVALPQGWISFGFLRGRMAESARMLVANEDSLSLARPAEGGAVICETAVEKTGLFVPTAVRMCRSLPYDWILDVDGDGMDDVIVPCTNGISVYLRGNEGTLSLAGKVVFDDTIIATVADISDVSSVPMLDALRAPIWLDPSLDGLPSLVLRGPARDETTVYLQPDPGKFAKGSIRGERGFPDIRQILRCSISKRLRNGLLMNVVYAIDGHATENVIQWKGKEAATRPLVLRACPFLARPCDIDRDGFTEILTIDMPSVQKVADRAARGIGSSVATTCYFVAWDDLREAWAQVSELFPVSMTVGREAAAGLGDVNMLFSKRFAVGCDLNGDGIGDIAWVESPLTLHVILLKKSADKIGALENVFLTVPTSVVEISEADVNADGVDELVVKCQPNTDLHGVGGNGGVRPFEYYVVHR